MEKHPDIQFQPAIKIKEYQETKLQAALQYLKEHSAFYQRMFEGQNIDINEIDLPAYCLYLSLSEHGQRVLLPSM